MQAQKTRYHLIDAVRGLAVINMVVFHFLYDVFIIYGKYPLWYGMPKVHIWQQAICMTFIFISGFVWQWGSGKNLRRGICYNLFGILITIVTLFMIPSETIWFGILNFIGCAVLLMLPLHKIFYKIRPVWGLGVSFFLFVLCKQIQYGYLYLGNLISIELPKMLYSSKILTPFGFPFTGFSSSDYFPIIPWIFLYLCGYFSNKIFMENDLFKYIACYKIPFLSAVGQKSIWVYLLHQPVSMLICIALFRIKLIL